MITGVIIHLENDLPIVVDLEQLPQPGDRMIMCTNVRTVDGKRPSFVNDKKGTFIFPLEGIRLIEAPSESGSRVGSIAFDNDESQTPAPQSPPPAAEDVGDEEPDQDLLARIRSI